MVTRGSYVCAYTYGKILRGIPIYFGGLQISQNSDGFRQNNSHLECLQMSDTFFKLLY